ncbi:restriction endonuclease subunit S [Desemzia incerta]|uniref:restriction endonuclease subunit S n=1 Tax=Desemzia incerta TaxID=82801 RepID=UPI003D00EF35
MFGDWEQRKLVEISEGFEYGLNASATDYDGENKYLRITDIDDASRKLIQTKLTSPEYDLKKADNYLLQHGDVLFTRTGASVGKTYRYDEKDGKVYYAGFLIRARIKSTYNPEFIFQNTLTSKFKNFIRITSQRSGQPGINANEYGSFKIFVPNKEEQSKVGSLFKHLDDTIALHQNKLEKLKQLKKAYLRVMFPKTGEKNPQLRFANFSNDWENRKLGDMLEERNEQIPENEEYPLMSFVQGLGVTPKGDRYDRSFLVKDNNKKYKKTELRDFIYSSNNLETGSIGFNKIGKALISPVYSVFSSKNKLESEFIGIISTRKDFINKMVHFRQGVVYGQWRIHEKDFLSIEIFVPLFEEQRKIISFFKQLDEIITLHHDTVEKLKQLKETCLQKLFI